LAEGAVWDDPGAGIVLELRTAFARACRMIKLSRPVLPPMIAVAIAG